MKTDRFGVPKVPGDAYRAWKKYGDGRSWKALQKAFRRKKRRRKISALSRKGRRPRRTMRPRPA